MLQHVTAHGISKFARANILYVWPLTMKNLGVQKTAVRTFTSYAKQSKAQGHAAIRRLPTKQVLHG